jgi:hypothetical protein
MQTVGTAWERIFCRKNNGHKKQNQNYGVRSFVLFLSENKTFKNTSIEK